MTEDSPTAVGALVLWMLNSSRQEIVFDDDTANWILPSFWVPQVNRLAALRQAIVDAVSNLLVVRWTNVDRWTSPRGEIHATPIDVVNLPLEDLRSVVLGLRLTKHGEVMARSLIDRVAEPQDPPPPTNQAVV